MIKLILLLMLGLLMQGCLSLEFTNPIESLSPEPCPGTPTVSYAGKTYNTVKIGNQCWLKENLDVGEFIWSGAVQKNNGQIEKYCYDNDSANCALYGGLYLWDEAMQYSTTPGAQGICPVGWHIPTGEEFNKLGDAVGHHINVLMGNSQQEVVSYNTNTNESGFSALNAGYYVDYGSGGFNELGTYSLLYIDQKAFASYNLGLYLIDSSSRDFFIVEHKNKYGFSVRCIKD